MVSQFLTCTMWHVRKLAFALKFRSWNSRNLFGSLYEAAIFSEFKSKILFLLKVTLYMVKMGLTHLLIHSLQGDKIPSAQVLVAAEPGALPAPFACILGEFCERGSGAMEPIWEEGGIRACFQPVFSGAELGAAFPVPGGGDAAAEPPLRPLLAVGAKCSSCSARTFPGLQCTALC